VLLGADVNFKLEFTSMTLRHRGYLPHLESPNSIYFVTLCLAGSIPAAVSANWRFERENIIKDAQSQKRELSVYERDKLKYLFSSKMEKYLDRHYGDCWLRQPAIAKVVVETLRHFDGTRYSLHAWCVMPNHVHVVFSAISRGMKLDSDLIPILHSWKWFTGHQANKILNRKGPFWQAEYYDHLIRSDEEYAHYIDYTLQNPVKAKLCSDWQDWPWSGCSEKIRSLMVD
jgi:REP element-mobilizing transposase RayT